MNVIDLSFLFDTANIYYQTTMEFSVTMNMDLDLQWKLLRTPLAWNINLQMYLLIRILV